MAVLSLVAGAITLIALVAGLLNYFGNRAEHAWYVSLIAYVSWFFPFSIVVLVPLDLSSVIHSSWDPVSPCLALPRVRMHACNILIGWPTDGLTDR